MKQFVIKEHPFKLTFEYDDEFLSGIEDFDEDGLEEVRGELQEALHTLAVQCYTLKSQSEASKKM